MVSEQTTAIALYICVAIGGGCLGLALPDCCLTVLSSDGNLHGRRTRAPTSGHDRRAASNPHKQMVSHLPQWMDVHT